MILHDNLILGIKHGNMNMSYLITLLQGVSIASYAEPNISYSRVVHLSHIGAVSKRCKLGSWNLHRRIAQGI